MIDFDNLEAEEEKINEILKSELNLREKFLGNYYLVGTYGRRNELAKSIEHGLKCLEISKDENFVKENVPLAQVYGALADLYFKQEDYEKSVEMYNHALELNPKDLLVLDSMLTSLFFSGHFEEGIKIIERQEEILEHTTEDLVVKKASLYQKLEQYKNAEKCYEQGMKTFPESRFILKNFATFYSAIHDKENFHECLQRYKKLIPQGQYDLDIVIHLLNAGNLDEAFDFLSIISKVYLKRRIEHDPEAKHQKEIILSLLFQWSEKIGISNEDDMRCLDFIDEYSNDESQKLTAKINKIRRKIYDDQLSIMEDLKQASELVIGSVENALVTINYADKLRKEKPNDAIEYMKLAITSLSKIENLKFQDALEFKFCLDPILFLIEKNENNLALEFINICEIGYGDRYTDNLQILKGFCYFYDTKFDEALKYLQDFDKSKLEEQLYRSVNFMLAVIHFDKQNHQEVIKYGEKSLRVFPDLIPDQLFEILSFSSKEIGDEKKAEFYKNQIKK